MQECEREPHGECRQRLNRGKPEVGNDGHTRRVYFSFEMDTADDGEVCIVDKSVRRRVRSLHMSDRLRMLSVDWLLGKDAR